MNELIRLANLAVRYDNEHNYQLALVFYVRTVNLFAVIKLDNPGVRERVVAYSRRLHKIGSELYVNKDEVVA